MKRGRSVDMVGGLETSVCVCVCKRTVGTRRPVFKKVLRIGASLESADTLPAPKFSERRSRGSTRPPKRAEGNTPLWWWQKRQQSTTTSSEHRPSFRAFSNNWSRKLNEEKREHWDSSSYASTEQHQHSKRERERDERERPHAASSSTDGEARKINREA